MKTGSSKIASLINRAWRLRFEHKNAEVERVLKSIEDLLPTSGDIEQEWQAKLLSVSLLRGKGDIARAQELISVLGDEISESGHEPPFQYYFQRALNSYFEDLSVSLEFFLLAESVARTPTERVMCLMNQLMCLENLNLPLIKTLSDLEKMISKIEEEEFSNSVRKQLAAYYHRGAFRNGDLRTLFSEPASKEMDLSTFYRLWVSRLPFVRRKLKNESDFLQKLVMGQNVFRKNYLLKTITADPRVTKASAKPLTSHEVDRIYLWTWYWLSDPSERHRQNLIEALREFDFLAALKTMSFEDFQMLRNALSWLSIFQAQLAPWIDGYLQKISASSDYEPFPIFDYERRWIDYLKARSLGEDGQIQRKLIDEHPLSRSQDLKLDDFAREWEESIESHQAPLRAKLTVVEETHEIRTRSKTLISEPLARILIAFSKKSTLTFAEVLSICFAITPYDHEVHSMKIHNLLARLKEILPKTVKIQTKNKIIYWQGPTEFLKISSPLPLQKKLFKDSFDFTGSIASPLRRRFERPLHPRSVVKKAGGKRELTREEIQEIMRISKASTVRWIEKWQNQGLIKRHGSGRSSSYIIEIADQYRLS